MLRAINRRIDRFVEWCVIVLFAAITLMGGMQVVSRFVLNRPLNWSEELQIFGHVWMIFLTIPIAYNRGSHIVMSMLLDRVPRGTQKTIAIVVDLMWLWLGTSIVVYTLRLVQVATFQRSPAVEVPMSYIYMGMVAGGVYLVFVAIRKLAVHLRGEQIEPPAAGEAPL